MGHTSVCRSMISWPTRGMVALVFSHSTVCNSRGEAATVSRSFFTQDGGEWVFLMPSHALLLGVCCLSCWEKDRGKKLVFSDCHIIRIYILSPFGELTLPHTSLFMSFPKGIVDISNNKLFQFLAKLNDSELYHCHGHVCALKIQCVGFSGIKHCRCKTEPTEYLSPFAFLSRASAYLLPLLKVRTLF